MNDILSTSIAHALIAASVFLGYCLLAVVRSMRL